MGQKLTTEEFISRAKSIHGDKYDYSKTEYVHSKTKICITCPEHGDFWIVPTKHIFRKQGCAKCSGNYHYTAEEWIEEAKKIHGDKYDYGKTVYVKDKAKVCITCPEHGDFWQDPHSHLEGCGCPKCAGKNKTTEEFIEEAKSVHSDKYDYSKVNYIDADTKVCIICPEHGEFEQAPHNHLQGHGCPKCNQSKGELRIEQYLIEHNIKFEYQKEFDSCKNKDLLPFDFYLPDYNLCIEYQGIQHIIPIEHFGGENKFKRQQINDTIKRNWCSLPDNPNLLEIKYSDDLLTILNTNFKDNIEGKLL